MAASRCMCRMWNFFSVTRFSSVSATKTSVPLSVHFCKSTARHINKRPLINAIAVSCYSNTSERRPHSETQSGRVPHLGVGSTTKTNTVSGLGLADEILGSKIQSDEDKSSKTGRSEESEEAKKRRETSWKFMKITFIVFGVSMGGLGAFILIEWGKPLTNKDGTIIEDEFSHMPLIQQYLYRTWKEIRYYDKMIKEPSFEKLLPDPLEEPYFQPPYTLVLELTGVLVNPDWTYQTGWRFKKRPGIDFFLSQISPPLFEVVVYTAEQGFTAFPIIDALDPNGFIWYRLFRDATRYVDGHHVKDLSCLNRDLSKVIIVDWDQRSFKLHSRNALKLKKWTGNDDDRTLLDLAVLLRTIAMSNVTDVREVLDFYKQFDNPVEAFKENQRKVQEEQERALKLHRDRVEKGGSLTGSWTSSFLSRNR